MVVLKLILDIMEKFKNLECHKLRKGEPLNHNLKFYTRFSGVDNDKRKKLFGPFNSGFLKFLSKGS